MKPYAVRYSAFSGKDGFGPLKHYEKSFATRAKMDAWVATAEDKVRGFHEITAYSFPAAR